MMYHIRASILFYGIAFVFNFVRADYLTIKEERSYADPPTGDLSLIHI